MSETSPNLWWHSAVEGFTFLAASELPSGVTSGVRFTAICINVPRYLQYLLSSFLASDGKLVKVRLATKSQDFLSILESAGAHVQAKGLGAALAFVNATGIGARTLVGDESIFPTKGQTVLVKGESRFAKTTDKNQYVIPRPGSGTTILGGTREDGNCHVSLGASPGRGADQIRSTEPSEDATMSILEGCKSLAPELLNNNGEFEVLSVHCGLRPSRKGGPRVELEVVNGMYPVVHSYGHAGAGYQNAVGSSRKVVRLVNKLDMQRSLKAKI